MKITYWHRLAQLYLNKELSLAEIAKVWIINTAIGIIVEDDPDVTNIGINVFDNSAINTALVFGVLYNFPDEHLISYPDIGKMLLIHAQTVGKGVKLLVADGYISKTDYGSSGSTYKIRNVPAYPMWILSFTKAIVEIATDDDLQKKVEKECENIKFARGVQVLQTELRNKFYHRKKPESDSNPLTDTN